METVYLDTHVVVWLFAGEIDKLSDTAREYIEERDLLVSPMVLLELEFLYEIGRLRYRQDAIVDSLSQTIDLKLCKLPFATIAREATRHDWTRDPFDRLIVANTICNDSVLLSRDRNILKHCQRAIW